MASKKFAPRFLVVFALSLLSGCATPPDWFPSSGPSRKQEEQPEPRADSLVRLIEVDDAVARRLLESAQQQRFSQLLVGSGARGYAVGPGDVLEVSIWEAPPAAELQKFLNILTSSLFSVSSLANLGN